MVKHFIIFTYLLYILFLYNTFLQVNPVNNFSDIALIYNVLIQLHELILQDENLRVLVMDEFMKLHPEIEIPLVLKAKNSFITFPNYLFLFNFFDLNGFNLGIKISTELLEYLYEFNNTFKALSQQKNIYIFTNFIFELYLKDNLNQKYIYVLLEHIPQTTNNYKLFVSVLSNILLKNNL